MDVAGKFWKTGFPFHGDDIAALHVFISHTSPPTPSSIFVKIKSPGNLQLIANIVMKAES